VSNSDDRAQTSFLPSSLRCDGRCDHAPNDTYKFSHVTVQKRVSVKKSNGVCDWGRTHIAIERKHKEWRERSSYQSSVAPIERATLPYTRFRTRCTERTRHGRVPKPPFNILLPSGQLVFGRDAHTNSFETRMEPTQRSLGQPLAFAFDDICASECARRLLRWVMHRVHGAVTRETRALAGARSAV
jgi:hypothetical protein